MLKTYVFKATCMSGRQGDKAQLQSDAHHTQELLRKGFIEEVKVVEQRETKVIEPTETKAKPKRKSRKKKAAE